ncbi:hypothetical protein SEA_EYRE_32 [Gordonia phage Eyre]|uniref:Uncharacterized protein n=1 Tax=Gordonia phage Eyre TaxID=1887646 RepID=A0A1B3AZY6_9CAUD|nr:hypothetical protein BIZ73_gp32 [Gordonia phage Eyre]AOE44312.1 hypothetical protein SEA_EYRE_32 [Gordonia phage Eyre]
MKRSVVAAAGVAVMWAGMLGGVGIAAAAEKPCVMPIAGGGSAPCPPPIVSTNGDSIGGGANTDPVSAGSGESSSYKYEAPTWKPAPEPEPEPEPEAPSE